MLIDRLAIAVTFFYNESRFKYLKRITHAHLNLANESTTFIITNTKKPEEINRIKENTYFKELVIISPSNLGHPYLLTWAHRDVFKDCLKDEKNYSHFLYTEDDLLITLENIDYWIKGMKMLESTSYIPGFVRYEINNKGEFVCTDKTYTAQVRRLAKVSIGNNKMINLPQPYQGMYLLNKKLAKDFLYSEAGSPDTGIWNIREKAAQGLTFWETPNGATSRYLVGFNGDYKIDKGALIHHLPNNYALNDDEHYGSLKVSEIARYEPLHIWLLWIFYKILKRIINKFRVF